MSEYIIEVSEWVIDANGNPPSGLGEEIVRCRDCKEYIEFKDCATCGYFGGDYVDVEPDGFCAWGERTVENE